MDSTELTLGRPAYLSENKRSELAFWDFKFKLLPKTEQKSLVIFVCISKILPDQKEVGLDRSDKSLLIQNIVVLISKRHFNRKWHKLQNDPVLEVSIWVYEWTNQHWSLHWSLKVGPFWLQVKWIFKSYRTFVCISICKSLYCVIFCKSVYKDLTHADIVTGSLNYLINSWFYKR